MDTGGLAGPDATLPIGRSRGRVLEMLQEESAPLRVREVAQRTGLHPNTARFHLEALADSGLASRVRLKQPAAGRPAMAYRAREGIASAGQRRYRLLAEMLSTLISGLMHEPADASAQAGREWGAYLAEHPLPYQRPTAAEAMGKLVAILAELGFAPRLAADVPRYRIDLAECPFREVARRHQDVVCSLHLGLMQGALSRMRAPVNAGRLEPFVEPGLCVAHLTASGRVSG